jgi:hypothetical protein
MESQIPSNLIQLIITLDPATKRVEVQGPLNEFKLCCSIMDSARDVIFDMALNRVKQIVIAPAGSVPLEIA